jgi:hypothetical protein
LVFVAGAAEPPGRVVVNGRQAFLEGIGFRLILRYHHSGRKLIRIAATQPGCRATRAWIGVPVRCAAPALGERGFPTDSPQAVMLCE